MLTEKEVNYDTIYKNFNNTSVSLYDCICPFATGEADIKQVFKDDVFALKAEGKSYYNIRICAPHGAFDKPKDVESCFNLFVDACNIRPNVIFGPEMRVYDEESIRFFAKLTKDEVENVCRAEGFALIVGAGPVSNKNMVYGVDEEGW